MLEFVQFIVQTLKEKEVESTLSQAQKSEVMLRLKEVQENPSVCVSGIEAEEELIAKGTTTNLVGYAIMIECDND